MSKRKILFLGETYRPDAITWMKGLKEFGDFEIICWELKTSNKSFLTRLFRLVEFVSAIIRVRKLIKLEKPDMLIAERTTSYGFLATVMGVKPVAIAQQGRTDLWPENSILLPLKKVIQKYAFKKADLIHAWGPVMTISMKKNKVDMTKVLVLPKGIDLKLFENKENEFSTKITAIVTRSLLIEYRHEIIIEAFNILHQSGIDFELTIVGDGKLLPHLKAIVKKLNLDTKIIFTGRISNHILPKLLQKSNFYISMPITEGVSASLFEAMASNCYPLVSDLPGNQSWIQHRKNGQLIAIDHPKMLAEELIWAFNNISYRKEAIEKNRKFIEKHANYNVNMTIIVTKYHELIGSKKI